MTAYFFLMLYLSISHTHCEDKLLQEPVKTVKVGDSVVLTCKCPKDRRTSTVWIKHSFGERPVAIATSYQNQPVTFHKDFDQRARFNTTTGDSSFNFSISKTDLSDSAIYYCAITFLYEITFGQGTLLLVKDEPSTSVKLLQQPLLNPVHPGEPVTFQCTVLNRSCVGEHRVYWFKQGSGESQPGIVYNQGDSSECKKNAEAVSLTQSCVYKLSKNVSHSDAGTYYCAITACGQIFFGNGTKLDFKDGGYNHIRLLVLLSIIRSAILLTFIVFLYCYLTYQ